MMEQHRWTAVVSIVALLLYFYMGLQVGRARGTSGISAPTMVGHPTLERAVRVQMNTLEWLPLFLTGLFAAGLGVVWIVGRFLYSTGYMNDPGKRSTGFMIQMVAVAVLLLGALGKIVYSLATGGV